MDRSLDEILAERQSVCDLFPITMSLRGPRTILTARRPIEEVAATEATTAVTAEAVVIGDAASGSSRNTLEMALER